MKRAGTMQQMLEEFVRYLNSLPPDEQARHKQVLHDAFVQMAESDYQPSGRILTPKAQAWLAKVPERVESLYPSKPEPLPPLPPEKARIISF